MALALRNEFILHSFKFLFPNFAKYSRKKSTLLQRSWSPNLIAIRDRNFM